MGSNPTGFKITDTAAGWSGADFEDVFVRKDCFLEGGLWTWGGPFGGGLGDNTTISKSSPVQTISGGTNWRSVSAGGGTSGAIKTDGTLWMWDEAGAGALGNDSTIDRSSPVQTISGGTNWRSVSAGSLQHAGIKTDGTLWLWGCGNAGALGNNSSVSASSPVQTISGGTNWKSVSVFKGVPFAAGAAAIKTDGTLWLWGLGSYGRLGNNNSIPQSSPVQTISGGTDWKSVSSGELRAAAIKTNGTLWVWGSGCYSGTNSTINRSSPVQTISGGTDWRSVSSGDSHTAAIKTDGTLWAWGNNAGGNAGALGDGSVLTRNSPVQTISGGTNWKSVSAGESHTAAIKTDGTLWVWGCAATVGLGDNTTLPRSSPVQTISGGTNWRSVSAGNRLVLAIREDCW
jgi:alpha-tubulin suppressor-like RCC1 family protein